MNSENSTMLELVRNKLREWRKEIQELCTAENPDIQYGFRLGKLHHEMWEFWMELSEMENDK